MRRFLLLLSVALPVLTHADSAPSLKGTWRAYVTTQGIVTGRTDTRYVFGDLGWAIRDATGAHPQDWYRVEDGKLLLRPAADAFPAGFDAADAALTFTLEKDASAFGLSMPGTNRHALRFEREETRPELSAKDVTGRYRLEQRRLGSDERRDAPFTVNLAADGTYRLESLPPVTAPYATGRYEVRDDTLTLIPATPSGGLWDKPTFFPYHGTLVYESRSAAVRLIPLPKPDSPKP